MADSQAPQASQWAFEATYNSSLPPHLSFNPDTDFLALVNWAAALEPSVSSPGVMPVPVVATYASARDKKSEVDSNPKDSSAWLAAKAGSTLSVATPKWPARRAVLGVVTLSDIRAIGESEGY
jgi:hypothetical protein